MPAYDYIHVVGFEDTNLVGNVYFTRFLSWQGRCRELFLRDHAPAVADELADDLRLVTTSVSCEYFAELHAFDEVVIRMRLRAATQTRVAMDFEYLCRTKKGDAPIARGHQEAACLRVQPNGVAVPAPLPAQLREALDAYEPVVSVGSAAGTAATPATGGQA
jgi:enediyne biosynthesis thioesterase